MLYNNNVLTFRREDEDVDNRFYNRAAIKENDIIQFLTQKLAK